MVNYSAEKVQEIVEEKEAEYKELEEEYSFLKEEYEDLKAENEDLEDRCESYKKQTKLYCASIMKTQKRWMIFRSLTINSLKAAKRLTGISLS